MKQLPTLIGNTWKAFNTLGARLVCFCFYLDIFGPWVSSRIHLQNLCQVALVMSWFFLDAKSVQVLTRTLTWVSPTDWKCMNNTCQSLRKINNVFLHAQFFCHYPTYPLCPRSKLGLIILSLWQCLLSSVFTARLNRFNNSSYVVNYAKTDFEKKNEMKSFFSRETSRVSQTSLLMQSVRKYLPVPMFSCLRPFTRAAPVLAYLCCRLHDHALIVFTIDGFLLTEHVPSSPLAQLLHHKSLFKQLLAYLKQA